MFTKSTCSHMHDACQVNCQIHSNGHITQAAGRNAVVSAHHCALIGYGVLVISTYYFLIVVGCHQEVSRKVHSRGAEGRAPLRQTLS